MSDYDSDAHLNEVLQQVISDLIEESIEKHFDGQKPTVIYENIEDYNRKTGKRFRMTKDQKERGLSRQEAFHESFNKGEGDVNGATTI
tara:strand:- start:146 stop:409 length:264 start_codon:yes stop_codon:yes gene_type:complete